MFVCVPDGDSAQDVSDFNWDDYLEETGSLSVPHHAFKHVGADNPHSSHTAAVYNPFLSITKHLFKVLSNCVLNLKA